MQSNFFRAPSLPKLGTRRVSSSIFGGGRRSSTPVLNVRNFSFGGEKDFSKTVKNIESTIKQVAEVVNKSTVKINTLESKVNDFDSALSNNIGIDKNNITKTLVETNKILVEIQKQLAYDFALRIADEKEAIKRAKAAESKRKFAAKEKSVEGIKKFGSFAENIVDRVTAPIKSVFDRIKEFFGLILTGIVTNAVFTWLGDPENRKKLNTIFDWVGKIFVGLLLGVITFKFIKWSIRLFKLVRFFWRLPGKIKALFDGLRGIIRRIGERLGLKPKTTRPTSPRTRTSPRTPTLPRTPTPIPPTPRPAPPSPLLGPNGKPLPRDPLSPYKGSGSIPGRAPNIPKPLTPSPKGSAFNPFKGLNISSVFGGIFKVLNILGLGLLVTEVSRDLSQGDIKAAGVKLSAYGLGFLVAKLMQIAGSALLATPEPTMATKAGGIALIGGGIGAGISVDKFVRSIFGYKDGGTIKASNGMTVPGRGSKNVDSVNAMLAPGEEVIRTTSAMMFRPLLKDINDNAGRLWDSFSRAIGKLASVSEYQKEVSKEYSKVIKDFDEYLKQEINKKKTKTPSGGGGTRRPKISSEKVKQPQINTKVSFSSQQTNVRISSSPKITNVNMTPPPSSGGGITFLPMVLPTQKSKPPQIPTPQNTATDVPFITSVNMSNPYMQLTPEMYGIFV
jgi:hypothetical protein